MGADGYGYLYGGKEQEGSNFTAAAPFAVLATSTRGEA